MKPNQPCQDKEKHDSLEGIPSSLSAEQRSFLRNSAKLSDDTCTFNSQQQMNRLKKLESEVADIKIDCRRQAELIVMQKFEEFQQKNIE